VTSSTPVALDAVTTGSGPGLVLIHGTGADAASNWAPVIDSAADRYTIVAPNLPGAGATPLPDGPLDLDELADRVLATALAAGLHEFHLVGHSIGAVLATAVAAREPAAVTSLLLHAGWVVTGPRERFVFDLWARLLRTDPALLARHLVATAFGPGLHAALDDGGFAEIAAGFTALLDERILPQIDLDTRIDLRAALGAVQAPTLVLASADDQIVPSGHQRELAAGIRSARYSEVPGGHGLPFEDPARFAALVLDFVDASAAAPRNRSEAGVA
jgi:pimeloyl-ACP methyl ester carboxylesterase